jgi:hypothetical protein
LQAPNEPGGAAAVGSTCGLVLQLLEFIPEAKTAVLNALAFKPAVLTMLWRILAESLERLATEGGGVAAGNGGAKEELDLMQQESLFTMFCTVYDYFLMTADNEDFYVNQYPFRLEEVGLSGCAWWRVCVCVPLSFSRSSTSCMR